MITGSFSEISKQFEDIPTLIYDGPFSDHIERMQPRMTRNKRKFLKKKEKR